MRKIIDRIKRKFNKGIWIYAVYDPNTWEVKLTGISETREGIEQIHMENLDKSYFIRFLPCGFKTFYFQAEEIDTDWIYKFIEW